MRQGFALFAGIPADVIKATAHETEALGYSSFWVNHPGPVDGLAALGEVIARWVGHLLAVKGEIEPLTALRDVNLIWYVGLDVQATAIGDALWNGEDIDDAAQTRLVGLYRLAIPDTDVVLERAKGEPIYLLLAMTPDGLLRMKPQNLVTGLPIRQMETVS